MSENINPENIKTIARYKRFVTYVYCELCKINVSTQCYTKHSKNKSHVKRLNAKQLDNENNNNVLVFEN